MLAATNFHQLDAVDGFNRTNQHGFGHVFDIGDDVGAQVATVNQIDVDETARAVKNFRAFGQAFVRVRRRVKLAHVRFGLDDNAACQTVAQVRDEFFADKFAGDRQAVAQVKFTRKFQSTLIFIHRLL